MIQSINFADYPHKNEERDTPLKHRIGKFVYTPVVARDGAITWKKQAYVLGKEWF